MFKSDDLDHFVILCVHMHIEDVHVYVGFIRIYMHLTVDD